MASENQVNPFGELAKTSQMVQLTLNFDWGQTELGPIENWDLGLINFLRIVFSCPIGMYCTWGPERRVFYNDSYIPILKYRHPRALGSRLHDVWPEVWDQVDAIARTVEAGGVVRESDVQFDIEVAGKPQDNYFTYGNSPLFNAEGKISGMLCTILDTTTSVLRNIATEKNLQAAKIAAENANHAKSAFLANMSHEIRTPLGVILGFADAIATQEDLAPEDKQKYLDIILRNGASLTRIIDDILDLSKIEAGKFEAQMAPVGLRGLLQEVLTMYVDQANKKNIHLHVLSEIADLVVITDAVRIRQVLLNLIGNAIKFTTEGSVRISCRAEQLTGALKKITFTIEDTGIGMTKEQAGRLFQPFTQGDISSTRRFGGTGLGLALSRNLAHALGGDVKIVGCEPDKGCTFEFSFQAEDANQLAEVSPARSLTEKAHSPFAGVKVLIVDDLQDNRELLKTILKKAGFDIAEADSGEDALKQTSNQHYDLVLMDIQMPGLDGFSTLTELRKRGFQAPVVAVTAHAMKEDKDRAFAAGFADHLAKPIDSKLLVKTIQSQLKLL